MMDAMLVSTGMAVWTVLVHMVGLGSLLALARFRTSRIDPRGSVLRQALFILIIVLGLFVVHAVEIWSFALVYLALGAVSGFEEALYFSTSTFTHWAMAMSLSTMTGGWFRRWRALPDS